MYPISNRYKPKERLLPEEEEVQESLHEYNDDPDTVTWRHFTPATILYETYQAYADRFDRHHWEPEILDRRKFGAALRRVYPDVKRIQRTVKGRRLWGYFGLVGPGTVLVSLGPGNPKLVRSRKPTSSRHQ